MQAFSTVRQNMTSTFLTFGVMAALGGGMIYAALVSYPGSGSVALLAPGFVLATTGCVMLLLAGLSVNQRAEVDASGVRSHEFGARWSFGWNQVQHVWIVFHQGLPVLAVLPTPEAGRPRHRTRWRSRRLGLPDQARAIPLAEAALDGIAEAVRTNYGRAPEPLRR